jgi:chromosome segregation ATPase
MDNIQEDLRAARLRLSSASDVIGNLQDEIEEQLADKLGHLYYGLRALREASLQILSRHERRYLSLDLFRSKAQYSLSVEKTVNELITTLAAVVEEAGELHTRSKGVFLRTLDIQNFHLKPAKDTVQTLIGDISAKQSQLGRNLETAREEQVKARNDRASVQKAIEEKEQRIATASQASDQNKKQIESLRCDLRAAEQDRQTQSRRASELRSVSPS